MIPKIVVWIWVLIDAASLLNFFSQLFWDDGEDYYEQSLFDQCLYYSSVICDLFFHYMFSIEYLKAAMNLPIFMNFYAKDTSHKLEDNKRIINLMNFVFTLLTCTVLALQMSLINVTKSNEIFIWGNLGLNVIAAIILILSIQLLRRFLKTSSSQMQGFIMNERLMHIHTGLYFLFISAFFMQATSEHIRNHS